MLSGPEARQTTASHVRSLYGDGRGWRRAASCLEMRPAERKQTHNRDEQRRAIAEHAAVTEVRDPPCRLEQGERDQERRKARARHTPLARAHPEARRDYRDAPQQVGRPFDARMEGGDINASRRRACQRETRQHRNE